MYERGTGAIQAQSGMKKHANRDLNPLRRSKWMATDLPGKCKKLWKFKSTKAAPKKGE